MRKSTKRLSIEQTPGLILERDKSRKHRVHVNGLSSCSFWTLREVVSWLEEHGIEANKSPKRDRPVRPKRHTDSRRATRLKRNFGISAEEYEWFLSAQDGVCWICKAKPLRRSLAVDHDHKTDRLRRLLCTRCNVVLGHVKDSPELLESMAEYLRSQQ